MYISVSLLLYFNPYGQINDWGLSSRLQSESRAERISRSTSINPQIKCIVWVNSLSLNVSLKFFHSQRLKPLPVPLPVVLGVSARMRLVSDNNAALHVWGSRVCGGTCASWPLQRHRAHIETWLSVHTLLMIQSEYPMGTVFKSDRMTLKRKLVPHGRTLDSNSWSFLISL